MVSPLKWNLGVMGGQGQLFFIKSPPVVWFINLYTHITTTYVFNAKRERLMINLLCYQQNGLFNSQFYWISDETKVLILDSNYPETVDTYRTWLLCLSSWAFVLQKLVPAENESRGFSSTLNEAPGPIIPDSDTNGLCVIFTLTHGDKALPSIAWQQQKYQLYSLNHLVLNFHL